MKKMKNLKSTLMGASLLLAGLLTACSDVDLPQTPTMPGAEDIAYSIDGRSVTLSWAAPSAGVTEVRLYRDNTLIATLPADVNTYTVARQGANVEVLYTVKFVYSNGICSLGKTVGVTVEAEPAVPAMLLPVASVDELEDDDETAAARWFKTAYPQGALLDANTVTELDPDKYCVIWINIDRVGLAQGWRKLPKSISGTATVNMLKDYLALGGNLLLTKHATQMVVPTGIVSSMYAPGIFGSGDGGEGSDNWAMNCNIGMTYDRRHHDIFKGLATIGDYGHETFGLTGPGWREDHNCMWDLNSYGLDPTPNTVAAFEAETNSTVLATWAHVTDFAVAGIVEFKGTDERPGKCIANGLAAYEFNQNSGVNPFQGNVETLTKNCIDYLSK